MSARDKSIITVLFLSIILSGCIGSTGKTRITPARIIISEVGELSGVSAMDIHVQSISGTSVLRENTEMTSYQSFYKATVYDNNNNVVQNAPITWALSEDLGDLVTFSDPSIASIKPKNAGTGTLRARTGENATGELELIVYK